MQDTAPNQSPAKDGSRSVSHVSTMKLQKPVAKATKPAVKPVTVKHGKGPFLSIGPRGTAMVLGHLPEGLDITKPVTVAWPSFEATGISASRIGSAHAIGKPIGNAHDLCPWVAKRGDSFRVLPLAIALKTKLVRAVKVKVDGKACLAYLPFKWTNAEAFPQYTAVSLPQGRVETRTIANKPGSDKSRNGGLVREMELA